MRRLVVVVTVVGALLAAGHLPAGAAPRRDPAPGPALTVPQAELDRALHCPSLRVLRRRPPVLLVHGTSVTDDENWGWNYLPALRDEGFAVCTVLLPDRSLGDVQMTSEYAVHALRTIAARSRQKVSVVGVSQGAIQPRWALRWWPDIRHIVDDYVSMAGTNHGSAYGQASCADSCPPSIWQQSEHSMFLSALNSADETPGSVSYTSVYSLTDPIIQPVAPEPTAALDGAVNIAVQDVCPGRVVEHLHSVWDAVYYAAVLDALTHRGPANSARLDPSVCSEVAMPGVDVAEALRRTAEVYITAVDVQATYPDRTTHEPPLAPYAVIGADRGRFTRHVLSTDGVVRAFMVYDPGPALRPRPVVVYLHGCNESALEAAVATRWNKLAQRLGIVVVYPEQAPAANSGRCWNWYDPAHQHHGTGEPAAIAAITDLVVQRHGGDPSRVYVGGISAGAAMAVVMAVTYPDRYAAVAAEAGATYRGLPCAGVPCLVPPEMSAQWAYNEMGERARNVPLFTLVGDQDRVTPPENTDRLVNQWLTTADLVDDGKDNASVDRAPSRTRTAAPGGRYAHEVRAYALRNGCRVVEHWVIQGLAHNHSGGRAAGTFTDPLGPDAARAAWRFFSRHRADEPCI